MEVGQGKVRVDAYAKVCGEAKYTADLEPKNILHGKVLHSEIANGLVKSMDISEAEKVPGVVKVLTCFDVPDCQFPTAGHPWSVEEKHQDICDRRLLNRRVRFYGDDIACSTVGIAGYSSYSTLIFRRACCAATSSSAMTQAMSSP